MSEELCVFGEVLFDVFPGGHRVLGGAPFNVAWHLQAFSQEPFFISRVGNDPEGMQIRKAMLDWGMNTSALQTDDHLSTGRVSIELQDGEPEYDIVNPAAYDAIQVFSDCELACQFLYHGSLGIRNEISRRALEQIKSCQPKTVFVDVNLRNPWWDKHVVTELLKSADWVKLNNDELNLLYVSNESGKNVLSSFIAEYGLQGLILTHGSAGAEIMTANAEHYEIKPDVAVEVIDSVGAGDAFSAVTILGLNNNWLLKTTIQRAQNFASAIVGQRGATVTDQGFYQHFLNTWGIG